MAEIPILYPAGISSDSGQNEEVFRIRVENMTVRPIRRNSQRTVLRGLAQERLGRQRPQYAYGNDFHNHPHALPKTLGTESIEPQGLMLTYISYRDCKELLSLYKIRS